MKETTKLRVEQNETETQKIKIFEMTTPDQPPTKKNKDGCTLTRRAVRQAWVNPTKAESLAPSRPKRKINTPHIRGRKMQLPFLSHDQPLSPALRAGRMQGYPIHSNTHTMIRTTASTAIDGARRQDNSVYRTRPRSACRKQQIARENESRRVKPYEPIPTRRHSHTEINTLWLSCTSTCLPIKLS